MNPVMIKRITVHDGEYPQVWALREEVLRRPLGLSLHDEDLSGEENEYIIIAMQDEAVTGCVMLKPLSKGKLKLRQMAVALLFREKGIGAVLVREAEALAAEHGFTRITLHARLPAVPFYERCGYLGTGAVFTEVGIPHLLMQKQIS